ncbi:MAG: YebO family protein [Sodalis sp. (in: enterobacteria)]|uniref:YebO family protein n=1 Tax=Sodalis sp. (in: enterobacteria) TaxID=1898979 RepID=UPI0039E2D2EF
MNELGVNSLNIAIAVASVAVFVIVLVVWFFLSRASVKANEQIALLTELLEQQKQQTELLARLTRGESPNPASPPVPGESTMFKDFIAER